MALNFFLKRSGTASKRPDAANMAFGEIDLNYNGTTGGLFYRDSLNNVVKVGPAEVGASAPNATPAGSTGNSPGEFWYDTVNSVLKIWNGTAWVNTVSTSAFLPLAGGVMSGTITFNAEGRGLLFYDNSFMDSISDSPLIALSSIAASTVAVNSVYTLADAALPKSGGTMTGAIVFDETQTFPAAGVQDGTLTQKGVVQLEDSVTSTSTTLAATPNSVKTAYDLADAALPLSGGSMSGDIYLFSQVPTDAAMPASKYYADQIAMGYKWQTAVAAATTAALAGTVTYNNGTSGVGATLTLNTPITAIDGVTITTIGTRVLIKNQVNQAHNGIYTWTSGGATTVLTRATDADEVSEMLAGNAYYVNGGTVNGSQTFVQVPTITTIGTSAITYSLSSVRPFHKYSNEWNVDPVAGDDSNGTGSEEQPYKTIAKALSMAGGSGARIVLHQGIYTENLTITNQNLDLWGANRNGATINGTVNFAHTASSVRAYGIQFAGNVTHSGNGGLYLQQYTLASGVSITKSGNGYLELDDGSSDTATHSFTGAGYINIFNSRIGLVTVNNANAILTLFNNSSVGAVTVTAGILQAINSVIFSATESGNAITAGATSAVYLRSTNLFTPTGVTARASLAGGYSLDDSTIDRANSTFGTNLGTIARFDSVDVLGAVLANGSAGTAGQVLTSGGPGAAATWTSSAAGTLTSITAGTGLCGGTITSSGTISLDSACVINPSILTDQGYLITATAAATPVALAPGIGGQVLTVNYEVPAGLEWCTPTRGTVCSVIAGTGLSGGTITSSGTIALNNASSTALGGVKGCTDSTSAYLGCNAGLSVIGTCNVFLGAEAACNLSTGSCNVIIGAGVQPANTNAGCQLAIGAGTISWLTGTASGAIKPSKGIIDCNNSCGSAGQVLLSTGSNGVCWGAAAAPGIPCTCITGKGALVTGTGPSTPVALSVGTDGQALVACSACASGLTWATPAVPVVAASPTAAGIVLGVTNATNAAIGCNALLNNAGTNNVALGLNAGCAITSGSCNVAIGAGAQVASASGSCQLAIGFSGTDNWLTGDSSKNIQPGAGIKDCAGSVGTSGQILSSTGSAIKWRSGVVQQTASCTGNVTLSSEITSRGLSNGDSLTVYNSNGSAAPITLTAGAFTNYLSFSPVNATATTFAVPATGTVTLTLSDAATNAWYIDGYDAEPTAGAGIGSVVFKATLSAGLSLTANTLTKVPFDVASVNPNSYFNTTTNRFQPLVAGYYQLTASVSAPGASTYLATKILKNGSSEVYVENNNASTGNFAVASGQVYLNGSTDYVEVWVASGSNLTTNFAADSVFFSGNQINQTNTQIVGVPAAASFTVTGGNIANASGIAAVVPGTNSVTISNDFDPQNWINSSNGRITPTIPGYYQVDVTVTSAGSGSNTWGGFLKNGVAYGQSISPVTANAGNWNSAVYSAAVYLNGTTDYIQMGAAFQGATVPFSVGGSNPGINRISLSLVGANAAIGSLWLPSSWQRAGTIQSVGWQATTNASTYSNFVPGATLRNSVYYRQVGPKQWELVYKYAANGAPSSNPAGDSVFTLPAGLRFDNTLDWQLSYQGSIGSGSNANGVYLLGSGWTATVGFLSGGNRSVFGAGIGVWDATRFRIYATDSGSNILTPLRNNYYLNDTTVYFEAAFTMTTT